MDIDEQATDRGVAAGQLDAPGVAPVHRRRRRLAGNQASAQVLKKAGFSLNRIIPDNDTIRGVLFDDEEYIRTA